MSKKISRRHADRAPQKLPIRELACLSEASFKLPGRFEERRVSAGPSGPGALSFGSFSLGTQRK